MIRSLLPSISTQPRAWASTSSHFACTEKWWLRWVYTMIKKTWTFLVAVYHRQPLRSKSSHLGLRWTSFLTYWKSAVAWWKGALGMSRTRKVVVLLESPFATSPRPPIKLRSTCHVQMTMKARRPSMVQFMKRCPPIVANTIPFFLFYFIF